MAFNAVTPQLLASAQKAEDGGQQLAQMMNTLMTNLEPMAQGLIGQAGSTFTQVKMNVNTDLATIIQNLNDVVGGIRSSARDFDVHDSDSHTDLTKAGSDAGNIANRLRG